MINCHPDPDVCDCECHESELGATAHHIMPCCHRCPYCDQLIRAEVWLLHKSECENRRRKQEQEILDIIDRV